MLDGKDVLAAIQALKGNVPEAANTLEKIYAIITALPFLKAADIDTLAKLNAVLMDADLMDGKDILAAIDGVKGNVHESANTLAKLHELLKPILKAWVSGGNRFGEDVPLGTLDGFALPFITGSVERGRFDADGKFLIGHAELGMGKFHIRSDDASIDGYSAYIDSPNRDILFAVHNTGRIDIHKAGSNLLINGGWPLLSGQGNAILTPAGIGGSLIDTGSYNVVLGYNAASSPSLDPIRAVERSVAIGTEAGASGHDGANYTDSVYIGFSAGSNIRLGGGSRNTMIGGHAGGTGFQSGGDNTLVGYDSQNGSGNAFNTLLGSGTRAYNRLGDLMTEGSGQNYMTAIGAGAVVRTANTIVLGRVLNDQVVIGAERNDFQLPSNSPNTGLNGFKLQVIKPGGLGLGVSGASVFRDGNVTFTLGELGNGNVKNAFRINSYLQGDGGYEFILSANNINATLEISDHQFGGTKTEMLRLSSGGYANTAILVRPNDLYHTSYGYKYLTQGVNPGLQSRFISAFHGQMNLSVDDAFPSYNRAQVYTALASVTNHFVDGFFADVRATNPNAQAFAFRSTGSRIFFDGTGMSYTTPVTTIYSDSSSHAGANALLLNGSYVISTALFIVPMGAERTGMIISPGQTQANGLFISPQQSLGTYNYDGYLMWLQYSTTGNNMQGGTTKPMLLIRKHNAVLNGFDHTGAFLRMEENIGSTGAFVEAFKFDTVSNSLKLKFSINKDGVVSIGQVTLDPASIAGVGRLYFVGEDLKFVTPSGVVRTVKF